MRWNNMTSTAIKYGRKLVIYVPGEQVQGEAPEVVSEETPGAPGAGTPEGTTAVTPEPEALEEEAGETPGPGAAATAPPVAPGPEPVAAEPLTPLAPFPGEAGPPGPEPVAAEPLAPLTPSPAEDQASAPPEGAPTEETAPAGPAPRRVKLEHTVSDQDTLTGIAITYHVRVTDLLAWNDLKGPRIAPGQVLTIYLEPDAEYPTLPVDESAETVTYVVDQGDTLSRIATRFGVPAGAIMELNGLRNPNHIRLGQKLKIPRQAEGAP
jgi:LysM repeat protein